MKSAFSNTRALIGGLAIIALTNAIALGSVAYNRYGEPQATLLLTERELQFWPKPGSKGRSNGVDLYLHWRVRQVYAPGDFESAISRGRSADWLAPQQLRQLGFEGIDEPETARALGHREQLRVLFVLEFDGPAYHAELARARQRLRVVEALAATNPGKDQFQSRVAEARWDVEREERFEARLFIIDAGLDEHALRVRYPDRRRYVILGGHLHVLYSASPVYGRLQAVIGELDVDTIRVPRAYRATVQQLAKCGTVHTNGPRFTSTVHFGRRFEPWMSELRFLGPRFEDHRHGR